MKKFQSELDEIEKEHILQVLEHYGWNVEVTAQALDIPLKDLYNKLNYYGLNYEMPKDLESDS